MADERDIRRILKQHVQTDALLGVSAVPIAIRQLSGQPSAPSSTQQNAAPTQPAAGSATATAERNTFVPAAPKDNPLFAKSDEKRKRTAALPKLSKKKKLEILSQLDDEQVKNCTKCVLCEARTQTVFGEGDANAKIMFIGEGPGQTEDELGRPFVGRAGNLLEKMIVAMGYERKDVYIANVVKCRPPNNRTPLQDEVDACSDYLRIQIETIQPRAIVTLGGPAAKLILQTKEGITRLRGKWHDISAVLPDLPHIPVMPTFHPAYLLRQYTKENRAKVWSDLQAVMKHVEDEG